MDEFPKAWEPGPAEAAIRELWERSDAFRASGDPADPRPVYTLPLPLPNVTGSLHMGHALMGTLQDVLTRFERMSGKDTLWQPGLDHAGIATQVVVERQLAREGTTRQALGREAFQQRVWAWKEQSGGRILEQMKTLGCSCDWARTRFTMDPDMCRAVTEAFVRLHEQGLLYRATRLVNWDCATETVLSDLEVETEENVQGELFEFAYPVLDADPAQGAVELIVATTRPETMLGDTAVAVHPDDPRYRHLHGRRLKHPFVDREVPIITDAVLVDPEFGTGAVKVTPAHDFNDFATGKRHGLPEVSVIDLQGRMNEQAGEFRGLDRFEARRAVWRRLEELGLARGRRPHTMTLPRSQRSGTVVEPLISTQWFVSMGSMAEQALRAVREGRLRIVPEEWVKTWEHWLSNIQDWCVSRQLWWGHRIPAFHCESCAHVVVTREAAVARCPRCGSEAVSQDPDVLDTWFSSALWPFSTLGWPDDTPWLRRHYPADDLETGYDILFFWVARMVMMGLHFLGDVPFRRVLLHGMVVDETGEKMSKVKGNTLDPLDLIQGARFEDMVQRALPGAPVQEALAKFRKSYPSAAQLGTGFPAYGADALRFTLASHPPTAKRIALSPKRVEGYRHFCNKLYQAGRFALGHVQGVTPKGEPPPATALADRWILSRLAAAVEESARGIREFRLDEAAAALYRFFWTELCDWYLELCKPVFAEGTEEERAATRSVLAHVLETALRALHPFIPFVTEAVWQRLPRPASRPAVLALAPYPAARDGRRDPEAERAMQVVQAVIGAARAVRSEHDVHPGAEVPLELRATPELQAILKREARAIRTLVKTAGPPIHAEPGGPRPVGTVLTAAAEVEVLVGLAGLVEPEKEAARIDRALEKLARDLAGLERRLGTPSFVEKAPADVVAEAREQAAALLRQRQRLEAARDWVRELRGPGD